MNRERQQQFLEYLADQYKFYLDRREVFFARFDPANADKPHNQLHLSFEDGLNKRQKIQDELQNIGERLKQDGCEMVSKKGRAKKGESPWEKAYNWLWTVKFPEWEKDHEPPEEGINWKDLCNRAFWEEKTRRKRATEKGHEVQVYVPLGLVKRQQQPRRTGEEMPGAEAGMQQYQLTEKEIEERYEYEKFLAQVIGNAGENLAIIGEPGAGKTTWLDQIGQELIKTERYPIWIPLAQLQGMTLKEFLLEKWLKENLQILQPTGEQKQEFIDWFNKEKVWLLLDGADEMSAANPVVEICKSLEERWVKEARVVLSCRLNVWESNLITLDHFETYRTLCFEPEQVEQFITAWFEREEEPELGKQLAQKLQEAESARILDLVRNPLCLSLLCQSWRLNPGEIPETKAELYEKFCRNIYAWKQDRFPTTFVQQQQLNQQLAELALRGMRENVPLLESLVHEVLREWFQLAKNVGWLNVVYRDTRTDEPVYAFFHLTFQEYFAACAVADGHFFLPSDHSPEQPSSQPYRIFESRWREVILLWLGRGNVEEEEKEKFIQALVSFEDGCGECNSWNILSFVESVEVDRGFYQYRAYFLAAVGIREFNTCSFSDEIIQQILKWGFGYFNIIKEDKWWGWKFFNIEKHQWWEFIELVRNGARETLPKTDRQRAIQKLYDLLHHPQCSESSRRQAAESLGEIDPGNSHAITALVQLLEQTDDEETRRKVAESLGKIGQGNLGAITALVKLLEQSRHQYTFEQAAESLGKIGQGNLGAITALVKLLEQSRHQYTCRKAAESLGEIGQGNPEAIIVQFALDSLRWSHEYTRWQIAVSLSLGKIGQGNAHAIALLVQVLEQTDDQEIRWRVAESLGKIDPGNPQAIAALVQLLEQTDNAEIRICAAESLGEIGQGNVQAIAALVQLLEQTEDHYTRWRVAESLGKIDPGNLQAISALVQLLEQTDDEETRICAAKSLGKIDPGNLQAISALVQLLEQTDDQATRIYAAESLEEIGQGNVQAIAALVKLLEQTDNAETRIYAAESLGEIDPGNLQAIAALVQVLEQNQNEWMALEEIITTNRQRQSVVSALQPLLSDERCYKLFWKIAQDLPYPDFYHAWHHLDTTPHPEVADQTPVGKTALTDTLNAQLLDLPNQLHPTPHTTPVCVDIQHLTQITDEDKLAKALSNRIFGQLFPGQTLPKISDCCDLETELINAQPRPHIALILHNGDPQESLLHLCQFLAPTVSIACITHTPLDSPLRGFPPDQENLVSALQSWLESIKN